MSNTIKFTINIDGIKKIIDSLGDIAFKFENISSVFDNFSNNIQSAIQPGIALNSSLADLSAVAGVTGDGLKEIEGYARQTAKAFGLDAVQAVESYKLILSQLSPEIAKSPAAMNEMGNAIATLSKTMGGDSTAAAEVLTTAMNQYGVSLADPMEASRKMAKMMNVMAATLAEVVGQAVGGVNKALAGSPAEPHSVSADGVKITNL